jgi:hypothetical protein
LRYYSEVQKQLSIITREGAYGKWFFSGFEDGLAGSGLTKDHRSRNGIQHVLVHGHEYFSSKWQINAYALYEDAQENRR